MSADTYISVHQANADEQPVLTGFEIAVVGMAARFPGAPDAERFWENLIAGKETVSFFTEEELAAEGCSKELLAQNNYVRAKGIIEDADSFDADFFNLTSKEAILMDPQVRVLCETAYLALQDAACNPSACSGLIGVYMGAAPSVQWQQHSFRSCEKLFSEEFATLLLNDKDFISTRLSYLLNLKGPSMSVYTACSTSLVAVDTACQSLLTGKCDIALAGAVSISLPVKAGYSYQPGMIMSKDGHTKSFDMSATGSVFSDGAGVVVLKRLSDALEQGDNIHAVIKGIGINNDGSAKVGFTAPSVQGQAAAVKTAYDMAEVDPATVGYIEAHGSATFIGDRIELEALHEVFEQAGEDFRCPTGSVKSNFGHLNTAAGMAGLIKTILILKNGTIPPSLHCVNPVEALAEGRSPFYVNTALAEWKRNGQPRRAGVSSFGIGGTNVHVVLEEAPVQSAPVPADGGSLLVLSAKTPRALDRMTAELGSFIEKHSAAALEDIAYTLQLGRDVFPYRRFVVAGDTKKAASLLTGGGAARGVYSDNTGDIIPSLVMVFPGMGAGYRKTGAMLYSRYAYFRERIDYCYEILSFYGYSTADNIFLNSAGVAVPESGSSFLTNQLNIFIFEYALGSWLMAGGLTPSAFIGYSLGEYAAACLSGVFSVEDALGLLVSRGKLVNSLPEGAMLSVPLAAGITAGELPEGLYIAIDNGDSCVVAGALGAVKEYEKVCAEKRLFTFLVSGSHALHCPLPEKYEKSFLSFFSSIELSAPAIPFISNVTGTWITDEQACDPGYWLRHLTGTVRFSEGINTLICEFAGGTILEAGPGNEISLLIKRNLPEHATATVLNIAAGDDSPVPHLHYFLQRLGMLWLKGHNISWEYFQPENRGRKISLPGYSFEKHVYALQFDTSRQDVPQAAALPGAGVKQKMEEWFYLPGWKQAELLTTNSDTGTPVYLLLAPEGQELARQLAASNGVFILVESGSSYKKNNERHYIINPQQKEDFTRLFAGMQADNYRPTHIADLHNFTASAHNSEAAGTEAVTQHIYSDLSRISTLVQALDGAKLSESIQLNIISAEGFNVSGNEKPDVKKAPVQALLKVIPQEFPGMRCRIIDADSTNPIAVTAMQLLRELKSSQCEPAAAWRGRTRWVQHYRASPLAPVAEKPAVLKTGGNYLITGGFGNIGLAIAGFLHKSCNARIALCGRSGVPPVSSWDSILSEGESHPAYARIKALAGLEEQGANLYYCRADVADRAGMEKMLNELEATMGPLDGIFHAAGIIDRTGLQVIRDIQPADFEIQMQSKVNGTMVLAEVLRSRNPDFVVLTSSLSPVLGGLGLSAYAAANQFLDAFAQSRYADATRWISLNWADWAGWEKQVEGLMISHEATDINISAEEGIDTLKRVLHHCYDQPQVVISSASLEARIEKWVNLAGFEALQQNVKDGENQLRSVKSRPDVQTEYLAPETAIEEHVADIWQNILGYDTIGVNDDFMELGGDSLKAITMLSRLRKIADIDVPLEKFFTLRTVRAIAGLLSASASAAVERLPKAPQREYYPLSPAQRRLYFLRQFDVTGVGYNETHVEILEGELNLEKLEAAFAGVIARHDILRTVIEMSDEGPQQRVLQAAPFSLELLGNVAEPALESAISSFIRPFDLGVAPCMRVGVAETGPGKFVLILDRHHIISDVVSTEIMVREAISLYAGMPLAPVVYQYADYVEWQLQQKESGPIQKMAAFWKNKFSDEVPLISLPLDYPRPQVPGFTGGVYQYRLNEEMTAKLRQLALKQNSTMYNMLLSIVTVWLSKLSGQEDIAVGTPVVGRNHPDLENILGIFINTVVMRNQPEGEKRFSDFLAEVNRTTIEALENQLYQYEDLIEALELPRQTGNNPLFDVMFVMHNQAIPSLVIPGIKRSPGRFATTKSKVDINVVCWENDTHFDIEFEYSSSLFRHETIADWVGWFEQIVMTLAASPELALKEVSLLDKTAQRALMHRYRGVEVTGHADLVTQQLLEEQAAKTPSAVALTAFSETLTYDELNRAANRLAGLLRRMGAGRGTLVALMTGRDKVSVLGMLAVIKAGAAYLPIEPLLPEDRCRYMLEDSGAVILIADSSTTEKATLIIQGRDIPVINADTADTSGEEDSNPPCINKPDDTVYAIYTSGSTGKPKGILLKHRNAVNLIRHCADYASMDFSRVLQFSTISFDVSFSEIFYTLCSGGTVFLVPEPVRKDLVQLMQHIEKHQISTVFLPMSLLRMIFSDADNAALLPKCIRHIQTAGEQVVVNSLFRQFLKERGVWLHNHYGPSETHVVTTLAMDPAGHIPDLPSIGYPVINTDIYIFDRYGHILPPGIPGELYAGGEQVGAGYIGRETLTGQTFVSDPFRIGQKMYRTGDIACRHKNGAIDFLGRRDGQIKLRGYRVEPGEIENALLRVKGIKQAVIKLIIRPDGEKALCGYLVQEEEIAARQIREQLAAELPDYMIPSYLVAVEQLPVTNSGKIDYAALPAPDAVAEEDTEQPAGDEEIEMRRLWAEVLQLDEKRIGVTDNFFEKGGHSLRAMQLIYKVEKNFGARMVLAEFFRQPTIRESLMLLKKEIRPATAVIRPVENRGVCAASSFQQRLYYLQVSNPGSILYNMPSAFIIRGKVDVAKIAGAIRACISRHAVLRTSFTVEGQTIVQRTADSISWEPSVLPPAGENEILGMLKAFVQPFNLSEAPLLRAASAPLKDAEGILLLLDFHHIIFDGHTLQFFLDEFIAAYKGEDVVAEQLCYQDYAHWEQQIYPRELLVQQENYWLKRLGSIEREMFSLPFDYSRPSPMLQDGSSVYAQAEAGLYERIKNFSLEQGCSVYTVLLSAFSILLARATGNETVVIGTPVSGRRHPGLEEVWGPFINMLPAACTPFGEDTFRELAAAVHQGLMSDLENQEYSVDRIAQLLKIAPEAGRNPLFDAVLEMDYIAGRTIELPGATVEPYRIPRIIAKFDLALYCSDRDGVLHFEMNYATALFRASTAEQFMNYFTEILEQAMNCPDIKTGDISLAGQEAAV